jgi:hypothetical protein
MNFERYKNWSLVDPKPVIYYEPEIGEWCVFWNGIFMLYNSALILAGVFLLNSPSSKEVLSKADGKFENLYKAGLIDDVVTDHESWKSIINTGGCSRYYADVLGKHIKNTLTGNTRGDVWSWFRKVYDV